MMERVLVGIDGGAMSQLALRWAADLCGRAALECVAAHVFTPAQAELSPDLDAELHAQQQREIEGWCRSVAAETRVEVVLLDGDAPTALLADAEDRRADL